MTLPRGSRLARIEKHVVAFILAAAGIWFALGTAEAQVNGQGQRPYLGWSSFSEQTISGSFLTQANMQAQSDALAGSGLQKHGWQYINIDSGWMSTFDANGRPIPAAPNFPDIRGLVDHIHANGQKVGIYWIPGIEQPAVDGNYPILGTNYTTQQIVVTPLARGNAFAGAPPNPFHDKIDFTKPGAQEYINSIVALFASWGIDYIKLDGVTPGSYSDDTSIDNRADVAAWSKAIALSGRPMWFTVSWALDADYLSTWQQYSNARRIEDDVECEGNCATLTDWNRIYQRFRDLPAWQNAASPALGWNDLDSLDVINGTTDGLTNEEKRSAVSLWAMVDAPMTLGGDLTKLDSFSQGLLSNDEVLAIQQTGRPAKQVLGGNQPVWVTSLGNQTYYVAIFNLDDVSTVARLPWNLIGIQGALSVRDLWNHVDQGQSIGSYSTVLRGHSVQLLKVAGIGRSAPTASTSYEAEAATLNGSASVADCQPCSGGKKVGNLGLGAANTVTFGNVYVPRAGIYYMQVDSMTVGLRSYLYSVNGGTYQALNSGGGSFSFPASTVVPVRLNKGNNSIQFGNPFSYPPDLDRIVISGNGDGVMPIPAAYEAEAATLSGSASAGFSNYSSGLAQANNIGGGGTSVTFSNVNVPSDGVYQLQVDAATSGPRSFFLTVNGGTPLELALNGSSFGEPSNNVYRVKLQAGANTLVFDNPSNYAPNLDRIVIAPTIANDPSENTIPMLD